MLPILGLVALIVVVFFVVKGVRVTEGTKTDPVVDARSTAARERVLGQIRLERTASVDAAKRPRAEKFWRRATEPLGEVLQRARTAGVDVVEEDLGVELHRGPEIFYLRVDLTEPDPVFIIWTEDAASGESSELRRERLIRGMVERVDAWVDGG
jgi:hypothetical protein